MKSQFSRIRLALFASLAVMLITFACVFDTPVDAAYSATEAAARASITAAAKATDLAAVATLEAALTNEPPQNATAAAKATDDAALMKDFLQTATAAATATIAAPTVATSSATESNPQETVNTSVLVGDARSFSMPPTALAYANKDAAAPPQGFGVYPEGSPSYFHEWIFLTHPNDALEVDTPVSTTVGVEFWGDTNDGEARLLVDGVERWSGSTHGDDANWPGGAFVRYVQITGLQEQPHTVRIEQTGNGDVTVYYVGIGDVTP